MLQLIEPAPAWLPGYREAWLLSCRMVREGRISPHDLMFSDPDREDVIQAARDHLDPAKLKPGYVPAYDWFLVDGPLFLGRLSLRTALTPALLRFGGHIGYAVHPAYWGQGYGTRLLALGLERARELSVGERVLLTCDEDNLASRAVIERNGGVLEDIVENTVDGEAFLTRRYWIDLFPGRSPRTFS